MPNNPPSGSGHEPSDPPSSSRSPSPASPRRVLRAVALLLARQEVRNLRRWYEEFDRDILLPILLGEVALHNIGPRKEEEFLRGAGRGWRCELRPCNAYSIASAADLPRETVRRKISRLVELGWIDRHDNGHLFVTPAALAHFGALLGSRSLDELLVTADHARNLLEA